MCSQQVFLGDQSVGKTSIITRFMYDKFDNTYQVVHRSHRGMFGDLLCCWLTSHCESSGDHRHRLSVKDHVFRRQDCALTTLVSFSLTSAAFAVGIHYIKLCCCIWQGHSWAGALQKLDTQLY